MKDDIDLKFEKKSNGDMYAKTSQGDLSDAKEAKEKGAGLEGRGLALVGVNLSDVPVNGVSEAKKAGAGGGVDKSIFEKADIRELYNDTGKAANAGK